MKQRLHSSFPSSLKEALKWKETYLASLWDDNEGFKYPTFKEFLEIFSFYFRPIDQTQPANNRLISLRQGKRTVEEYLANFRLLTSLAGMTLDTRTPLLTTSI